jgi:hypothetical protein
LAFDIENDDISQAHVGDPQPDHFGASGAGPEVSPELLSSGSGNDFGAGLAALASELMLESKQEMVFLLRHYTDNLAPWYVAFHLKHISGSQTHACDRMDIFGDSRFFQTHMPRLVGSHATIKYTIATLAAKHLSNVGGFRPTHSCVRSNLTLTELYPSAVHADWAFKAANYYHQAATNLPLHNASESALREAGSPMLAEVVMASNAILTTHEMLDSDYDELHTQVPSSYWHVKFVSHICRGSCKSLYRLVYIQSC